MINSCSAATELSYVFSVWVCLWCVVQSENNQDESKGHVLSLLYLMIERVVANSFTSLSTNIVNKLNAFSRTHGKNTTSTQSINFSLSHPIGVQISFPIKSNIHSDQHTVKCANIRTRHQT